MDAIRIGERRVGPDHPCFVIAEIGSNHDGSLDRARHLVDEAAAAGADAVKLQSFTAEGLVNGTHPAYDVIARLSVPDDWHYKIRAHAEACGLVFLSAPFDEERAALLDAIGIAAFKVASSEVTNLPFLATLARYGRPVLLSTGLATLDEAATAVATMRAQGLAELVLLHCVAQYPTPFADVNLRAIEALRRLVPVVGFSDHSIGMAAPLGAVALGANILEKHVTDDRSRPGPDHGYAMEMGELRTLVARIRELEAALGDGVKRPTAVEEGERRFSFRGIYARTTLPAGTRLGPEHLKCVRPSAALGPSDLPQLLGRTLTAELAPHAPITWAHLA